MEEGIHPEYFAISDQEWDAIRLPIRDKISKLVDKALGESKGGTAEKLAREQYVERFLSKIWQAKDVGRYRTLHQGDADRAGEGAGGVLRLEGGLLL